MRGRDEAGERERGPAGGDPATKEGAAGTAAAIVPRRPTLAALRASAARCRACALWERATQTVFGEGVPGADVVFVGEQPGDREDEAGRPFVGPAGRELERAVVEAGLERRHLYITNAVKHFKWEARGKKRIHQKPSAGEVRACRPWVEAEIGALRPRAVVCLGATAAQSLMGRDVRIARDRGQPRATALAPLVMATIHPSAILRARDDEERRAMRTGLVADLLRLRVALQRLGDRRDAPGHPAPF